MNQESKTSREEQLREWKQRRAARPLSHASKPISKLPAPARPQGGEPAGKENSDVRKLSAPAKAQTGEPGGRETSHAHDGEPLAAKPAVAGSLRTSQVSSRLPLQIPAPAKPQEDSAAREVGPIPAEPAMPGSLRKPALSPTFQVSPQISLAS